MFIFPKSIALQMEKIEMYVIGVISLSTSEAAENKKDLKKNDRLRIGFKAEYLLFEMQRMQCNQSQLSGNLICHPAWLMTLLEQVVA